MNQNNCNERIYCDPKYIIKDTYIEKEVTFVHPIIYINRENIQYVPRHVYEEKTIHEVIDPGYPDCCDTDKKEKKSCTCCRKKRNCWSWF